MGNDDTIIVFLDGDNKRAVLAYNRMKDEDRSRTFWIKTVEEAFDLLENYRERLDWVSLEHDLVSSSYDHSSSEECGMEIVRWLEKKDPTNYKHVKFVIHTWNTTAGKKMTTRLQKAGYIAAYIPFGMMKVIG